MIANIIIGYVVGRYLYEKAIPFIKCAVKPIHRFSVDGM